MNRRLIGIAVALVLGIVGTIILVNYVQSARDDAAEPEPTTSVLVVSETIRQGATLDDVRAGVTPTEVPDDLLAEGVLESLDGLDPTLIAGVELQPGEQLLRSRLVLPDELVSIDVPEGLQELTIALDPERVIGGTDRGRVDSRRGDVIRPLRTRNVGSADGRPRVAGRERPDA